VTKSLCYDQNLFWFRNATQRYELQMTHHYCTSTAQVSKQTHSHTALTGMRWSCRYTNNIICEKRRPAAKEYDAWSPASTLTRRGMRVSGGNRLQRHNLKAWKGAQWGVFKKRTLKLKHIHMQLYIGVASKDRCREAVPALLNSGKETWMEYRCIWN